MRVVLHDYSGYVFPVELGIELARRGHEVTHLYSGSIQSPKGIAISAQEDLPSTFHIEPICLRKPFQKYSFFRRRFQEVEYGKRVADRLRALDADVVISSNTPVEAQASILKASRATGSRFIFWLQDVYGVAAHKLLRKRIPILGEVIGRYYMWLERRLLQRSDEVVLITEDFQPLMDAWNVSTEKTHVIPNWCPLDAITVGPRDNEWSRVQGLTDKFCFLYSGTLGLKHNPDMLLQLARRFQGDPDVRVVVITEGIGADWLREKKKVAGLDNLLLLDYLPFDRVPMAFSSADVLVALLEPDAGVFSVPSKVLAYLCAGRALLLAVPPENLAARIVSEADAGLVVPPCDLDAFLDAADRLVVESDTRAHCAKQARGYAEDHFNIEKIADRFEALMHG